MNFGFRPLVEDLTDQVLLGLASGQRHSVKRLRGHRTDVLAQLAAAVDGHKSGPPLKSVNTILRWIDVGANLMPRNPDDPLDIKNAPMRNAAPGDPLVNGLLADAQPLGEPGLTPSLVDDFFDRNHDAGLYRQCLSTASDACKAVNRQSLYSPAMPSDTRKSWRIQLGERIKEARVKRGMGQSEAAKKLDVKVQSIQQWETGRTSPQPENLAKLATVFETSCDALLGVDQPRRRATDTSDFGPSLRVMELAAQYGGGDPDDDLPRHRKAMMEAYGRLDPSIRFQIRCLIGTLAAVSNPSYLDWSAARDREAKARPLVKSKESK